MDPLSTYLLGQALAYLVSLGASLRADAIAAGREARLAQKLSEDLPGTLPDLGRPFQEELCEAAKQALANSANLGLSEYEEQLYRFFAIPANAGVLAAWLKAPGTDQQNELRTIMEQSLSQILGDESEDTLAIFFRQVERVVFANTTLANWLARQRDGAIYDQVQRNTKLLEELHEKVGGQMARQVLVFWMKAEDPRAEINQLLVSQDRETRRDGCYQFEKLGDRMAKLLEPLLSSEDTDTTRAVITELTDTLAQASIDAALIGERDTDPEVLFREIRRQNLEPGPQTLYDRLLEACCRITLDVAAGLPTYTPHNLADHLRSDLVAQTEDILAGIERMRLSSDQQRHSRFEERYRHAVARVLDRIVLFGTDDNRSKRYQLSVAYVSLSVEREYAPKDDEDGTGGHTELFSVKEILAAEPRLLVRGNPGSGKTTLMQWFAVKLAGSKLTGPLTDWKDHLPMFLRFRDFTELPAPEAFLDKTLPHLAGAVPHKAWVHDQLESGRAILLLDGLDEWAGNMEDVANWLESLMGEFPKCRVVLTSRPYTDTEAFLERLDFVEAGLRDMKRNDIDHFIDHWHRAMAHEARDVTERDELPGLANDLKDIVGANDALRKLATNPLLCAMICALFRARCRDLPTSRIELYQACRSMFYRRDSERKVSLEGYPSLSDDQKNRLLSVLAYWMVQNTAVRVEEDVVDRRLEPRLKEMDLTYSASDVRGLFVKRIGLLREPTPGFIDFPHKTFQELFAAEEALEQEAIDMLVNHAEKKAWREVVTLAAGLARPTEANRLITGLLDRGDADETQRRTFYLLAASCWTMARDKETLKQRVNEVLKGVVHPKTMKEAEELAQMGDLVLPFLQYDRGVPVPVQKARVRALGLIGSDAAFVLLKAYLADPRKGVEEQLFDNIGFVGDQTKYLARVFDKCEELDLSGYELISLDFLSNFDVIKALTISPHDLSTWPPFARLSQLTYLNLAECSGIKDLHPLEGLAQLKSLDLKECRRIDDLSPLAGLTQLTSLNLWQCHGIENLSPLAGLTQLTSLNLGWCHRIKDFTPLAGMTHLTSLDIRGCQGIKDFSPLVGLTQLTSLNLGYCDCIESLRPLEGLAQLTSLNLTGCRHIEDLNPLAKLTQLTSLNLFGCYGIRDLSPLAGLTQLTFLDLSHCNQIKDLSPLVRLALLTSLNLFECNCIGDLRPLSGLIQLTSLNLWGCYNIKNLNPLAGLIQLTSLDLPGCDGIKDFSPLKNLPRLKNSYVKQMIMTSLKPEGKAPHTD